MEKKLAKLKQHLLEIDDLNAAAALLLWDQTTYMPIGGASARSRQLGTLSRLAHEKFTEPQLGKLLDDLRPYEESLPFAHNDASLIRVTRRQYQRSTRIPADLMAELSQHNADSYQIWTKARAENNFALVEPTLNKTLDLSRRVANCFPGYDHIADPLIDFSDQGMKATDIQALFTQLREQLVPLVQAIAQQPVANDSCLRQSFPETSQLKFGEGIIIQYGYDFDRGRQDKTHHPYMTKFSLGDVRITTRTEENFLGQALFSTLHEAGHAMYEQGIDRTFEGTPLANGTSSGVHESQSRLWENIVGRSYGFWQHYYPQLQQVFPEQLGSISLNTFYKAINKVERSLIRTEADEVTYNLHVMIRFDLELALLEGKLNIKDLPDAWHERYQNDLGIQAETDTLGVLQDVHWYSGFIGGAFQGYTLGNIMSALFYNQALQAHPQIPDQISQGQFNTLHNWLSEHIYQHGSKFTALELIERTTGSGLTIKPYMRYLYQKYSQLYTLSQ